MTKYDAIPNTARVWIYQNKEIIAQEKVLKIQEKLATFTKQWTAHNQALRAYGEVRNQRFIILMVDESQAGASGCSIDKSVHFMQQLEQEFDLNLFDRMNFAYLENGAVKSASRDEFAQLFAEGKIDENTSVFDNLVKNKGEFDTAWVKKLGESWHKRMV